MARAVAVLSLILWSFAPLDVAPVKIPTPSGVPLEGRFADAGRGAPGVLFFPMCRREAMDGWLPIAARLLDAGVSSLLVTYREYGTSDTRVTGDQRTSDADGALAYLRSRIGQGADVAVAGSSCGVYHALSVAARHPDRIRAVVALTGPHTRAHVEFLSARSDIAVFSGAALEDVPAPDWARELKAASPSQSSATAFANGKAHGTDIFRDDQAFATELATWIAKQLTARR